MGGFKFFVVFLIFTLGYLAMETLQEFWFSFWTGQGKKNGMNDWFGLIVNTALISIFLAGTYFT